MRRINEVMNKKRADSIESHWKVTKKLRRRKQEKVSFSRWRCVTIASATQINNNNNKRRKYDTVNWIVSKTTFTDIHINISCELLYECIHSNVALMFCSNVFLLILISAPLCNLVFVSRWSDYFCSCSDFVVTSHGS